VNARKTSEFVVKSASCYFGWPQSFIPNPLRDLSQNAVGEQLLAHARTRSRLQTDYDVKTRRTQNLVRPRTISERISFRAALFT